MVKSKSLERRVAVQSGKGGKDLDALIQKVIDKETPPPPVVLKPWEARLERMKGFAKKISRTCIEFAEEIQAAIEADDHAHYGFASPDDYFHEKLGLAWGSVRKYLAPLRAIKALPESEREAATEALSEIGVSKAAAIAPAIERKPESLAAWIELAKNANKDVVQAKVSEALDHKPRGSAVANDPGVATLEFMIRRLPPEIQDSFRDAFWAWVRFHEMPSAYVGLCNLEILMRTDVMQGKGEPV
jgi:hypothetical protein